jgi:hypothetical protein
VISELSGAGTGLALAVAGFCASLCAQPAASATSNKIVNKQIFFVTLLSS